MKVLILALGFFTNIAFSAEVQHVVVFNFDAKKTDVKRDNRRLLPLNDVSERELAKGELSQEDIVKVNQVVERLARGDKEGNGGDYLLASFAQEWLKFTLERGYRSQNLYSQIVKKVLFVDTESICLVMSDTSILIGRHCYTRLREERKLEKVFKPILRSYKSYAVDNDLEWRKSSELCFNSQSQILDLPYPSDYLRVYMIRQIGRQGLFAETFGVPVDMQRFTDIEITPNIQFDNWGREVCARFVPGKTYYNRECWYQASGEEKLILVFHEIMRSMNVEDDDYLQTLRYLNQANCNNEWSNYRFLN